MKTTIYIPTGEGRELRLDLTARELREAGLDSGLVESRATVEDLRAVFALLAEAAAPLSFVSQFSDMEDPAATQDEANEQNAPLPNLADTSEASQGSPPNKTADEALTSMQAAYERELLAHPIYQEIADLLKDYPVVLVQPSDLAKLPRHPSAHKHETYGRGLLDTLSKLLRLRKWGLNPDRSLNIYR